MQTFKMYANPWKDSIYYSTHDNSLIHVWNFAVSASPQPNSLGTTKPSTNSIILSSSLATATPLAFSSIYGATPSGESVTTSLISVSYVTSAITSVVDLAEPRSISATQSFRSLYPTQAADSSSNVESESNYTLVIIGAVAGALILTVVSAASFYIVKWRGKESPSIEGAPTQLYNQSQLLSQSSQLGLPAHQQFQNGIMFTPSSSNRFLGSGKLHGLSTRKAHQGSLSFSSQTPTKTFAMTGISAGTQEPTFGRAVGGRHQTFTNDSMRRSGLALTGKPLTTMSAGNKYKSHFSIRNTLFSPALTSTTSMTSLLGQPTMAPSTTGMYFAKGPNVTVFTGSHFTSIPTQMTTTACTRTLAQTHGGTIAFPGFMNYSIDTLVKKETMIARGGFGEVWRGRFIVGIDPNYGTTDCAIKLSIVGSRSAEVARAQFQLECSLMMAVQSCDNIAKLFYTDDESMAMVTKLYACSLKDFIVGGQQDISSSMALSFASDILQGLKALHDFSIAHMDIKPHNCLIELQDGARGGMSWRVVVSDLGNAMIVSAERENRVRGRTKVLSGGISFRYSCLEQFILCESALEKSLTPEEYYNMDIFAFAMTAFEILTRTPPYPDLDYQSVRAKLVAGEYPKLPMILPGDEAGQRLVQIIHAGRSSPRLSAIRLLEMTVRSTRTINLLRS